MITPEETAELERLLADATVDTWKATSIWVQDRREQLGGYYDDEQCWLKGDDYLYDTGVFAAADAALIVFLRNHAAALLAAARQAEAKDARIAELVAALKDKTNG